MKTKTDNSEPWGVFRINDCDWWLARSAEEARADAARLYGCKPEDEEIDKDIPRLTEEQLEAHAFFPDADRGSKSITFAEELKNRITASNPRVEMFATTEF